MPTLKETRLRLLPYNLFFQDQVVEMRLQLGLPPNGVPPDLTQLCERWLKSRGAHPSGGFWPMGEYSKRAKNPSLWAHEVWGLRRSEDWDVHVRGWLNGIVRAYGVSEQTASAVIKYVIDSDWDSFKHSCDELKTPEISVKWSMTTGIVVTLEGVDADISHEDWNKIFDRLQPDLAKERHGTLDVDSSPSRGRRNFERDLFLFNARHDGFTFRQALEQWNEKHPEEPIFDETTARLAIDEIIELILPHEDWLVESWYDEKGNWHAKPGDRDALRTRVKQWLTEQAGQRGRA